MLIAACKMKRSPARRRQSKSSKFHPFLFAGCPLGITALFPLMFAFIFLTACSESKSDLPRQAPPVPVTVGPVTQKTVPVMVKAIGNVEAYTSVAVKARVGGELKRVHFQEGQEVKQGDLLFTIDPRPPSGAP